MTGLGDGPTSPTRRERRPPERHDGHDPAEHRLTGASLSRGRKMPRTP